MNERGGGRLLLRGVARREKENYIAVTKTGNELEGEVFFKIDWIMSKCKVCLSVAFTFQGK